MIVTILTILWFLSICIVVANPPTGEKDADLQDRTKPQQ